MPSRTVQLLTAVAAAAAATQVKVWAEAALQPLAQRALPPGLVEQQQLGADPSDHPENMPPTRLVDEVGQLARHEPLSDDARQAGSQAVHWVMGVGAGTAYALLARRFPVVRAGFGTVFGATLFAGTHGSLLPLVGIQGSLTSMPKAWWIWEPGSHLVYGATTEGLLRLGDGLLDGLG